MIDSTLKQELQLIKDRVDATMIELTLKKELQSIMDRVNAITVELNLKDGLETIKDNVDSMNTTASRSEEAVVERLEKNIATLDLSDESSKHQEYNMK
jgi:hypothetical protein